jgi:hypothetical protein
MTTARPQQASIFWPEQFTPGTTDNFVSNEVIAKDITATQIWALLSDCSRWESYYWNCANVQPPSASPYLAKDAIFSFCTFGFPALTAHVIECVAPGSAPGQEGRVAWQVKTEEGLEVYHAWLVEDLPGNRVRILTQESQIGEVFKGLAEGKPNVMLLGHQDWLDGLVKAARGITVQAKDTNLKSVGAWVRE